MLLIVVLAVIAIAAVAILHSDAAPTPRPQNGLAKAVFAGGCFWCMVHPFDQLNGVVKVTSGYAGGQSKDPTYEQVSGGGSGHRESVEVIYDPRQITYATLLDVFWHNVDPTNDAGQFCDAGPQYRSAVFYVDDAQRRLAAATKTALQKRMKVYTDILPAGDFYPAEEYHQNYYRKNPVRYRFYRLNCGRDYVLDRIWAGHP